MMKVIRRTAPVHHSTVRRLPARVETGSKVMRYIIIGLVTATIVGAFPLIRWYRVSDMKARWAAEDEERARSRVSGKAKIEKIRERFIRQEEARRWALAESNRDQRMKNYATSLRDIKPGTRPPDDCVTCEGLGWIKASPPPEKDKATPGIIGCEGCRGTGVRTNPQKLFLSRRYCSSTCSTCSPRKWRTGPAASRTSKPSIGSIPSTTPA